MRLLLAEDNALNRDMLARRLRRRGHEVIEAQDGGHALELARTMEPPDVVLVDLDMPVVDGWGVLSGLRSMGLTQPLFILSAHSLKDNRRRASELGVAAYLSKPIDFDELLRRLDEVAPTPKAASSP